MVIHSWGFKFQEDKTKTVLKEYDKLEVVQAQAWRLCCGAIKATPVSALQVEVGEIHFRFKQFMMNYWVNVQGHSED